MVQRRLARRASDWHKSTDDDLNAVHKRLQAWESRPDGPAAPLKCNDVDRMSEALTSSKMTGWISGRVPCKSVSGDAS